MGRLFQDPISFVLELIIKGYILFLIGGYCLIYSLVKEIVRLPESNSGFPESDTGFASEGKEVMSFSRAETSPIESAEGGSLDLRFHCDHKKIPKPASEGGPNQPRAP